MDGAGLELRFWAYLNIECDTPNNGSDKSSKCFYDNSKTNNEYPHIIFIYPSNIIPSIGY